jgi:Zn-dependent protease
VDWTSIAIGFGIFLVSLSVHESAHAWTAWKLGDTTGYALGRVSLNPARHVDPFGTILLPLILLYTSHGQLTFGYAKPVPYQPFRLRNPFLGSSAVAAAGPVSNFLLAVAAAVLLGLASPRGEIHGTLGHQVLKGAITLNVYLGLLNLLPIPPFDGGTVVAGLLPRSLAAGWARIEVAGPLVFVLLLTTNVLGRYLVPVVDDLSDHLFELARGIRG